MAVSGVMWNIGEKMDTSKEYIKMCEKAIEIQKLWRMKPKHDFFVFKKDYSLPECPSCCYTEHSSQRLENFIWLPRQDQLQSFIIPDFSGTYWVIDQFFHWIRNYSGIRTFKDNTSMEKLWLWFVMNEKYQKTWNGEDWV